MYAINQQRVSWGLCYCTAHRRHEVSPGDGELQRCGGFMPSINRGLVVVFATDLHIALMEGNVEMVGCKSGVVVLCLISVQIRRAHA